MSILFCTGVMGSGKTERLIKEAQKFLGSEKTVISATFEEHEERAPLGSIKSRSGLEEGSLLVKADDAQTLLQVLILSDLLGSKKVFIDEVQFFSKECIDIILFAAKNNSSEYEIELYGLTSDFKGEVFEASERLIQRLEENEVVLLEKTCDMTECFNQAEYNARVIDGKVQREGAVFEVEKGHYRSLCSDHYHE